MVQGIKKKKTKSGSPKPLARGADTADDGMAVNIDTPSDRDLWQFVSDGVAPLPDRTARVADVPPISLEDVDKVKPGKGQGGKKKRTPKPRAVNPASAAPLVRPSLPDLTLDAQPGLDRATAQRMKRGQVAIEATLDLHGMTQIQAHRALDAFLSAAHAAKRTFVLVITGKGTRGDGDGVLRQQVPRWLNESPNRERIVAFQPAAAKDGGSGALYIRLRKKA